jgi:formylglycine-generating enzyme required for sulfatase activity
MIKRITLLLLFILSSVFAQSISNVQARQEGLEIIITYDMTGGLQPGDEIKVGYSTDGGRNYKSISGADGDVGKNVKPGTSREISFLVNDALAGKNASFKVVVFSLPPGMVYVAGGTFQMGSSSGYSDEKPVHTVTVSSFIIDKTEVTQAEYRKVMGKNPSSFSGCDDCPVENVSWHDANTYAKKVGKRFPTEAEWEYAARGGNKSKGYTYSGSNDLDAVGWYDNNSGSKTHPVAQKQPNELGLYDMTGNVWEWCLDQHDKDYYHSSPKNDPQGPNSGARRVLRGGGWGSGGSRCRVAYRGGGNPGSGSLYYGFRLVLSQDL